MTVARVRQALHAAGPPLLFGLRLWASVCLALYVAFRLELDSAYWAGTSAALVCQPQLGASLRKGWFRMIGTIVGAIAIVLLSACFPEARVPFLIGLALWGGACAFVATLLHNYASYAAALAGFTAAIIAGDELGATGGTNGDAFTFALARVSEICIGIVCAGIVLAGTDLGGARARLGRLFADLGTGIAAQMTAMLTRAESDLLNTQPIRRDFIRQVIALDPVMDQTIGESSTIRYHTPILQRAQDGLFMTLSAWRAVANHLMRSTAEERRVGSELVLQSAELLLMPESTGAGLWQSRPTDVRLAYEAAAERLLGVPVSTPSERLIVDRMAEALGGLSLVLNGLGLLSNDPAGPIQRFRTKARVRVPDWLPPLVNAGHATVTIAAVSVFWIISGWPNGAAAITWAAITVIFFAPRADQAYASALKFTIGTALAAAFAAFVLFAVLPKLESFAGLALAMGAYMVPGGALIAQPWQTALFVPMVANFLPLLGPTNQMNYDTVGFYNGALALVAGCTVAALSFRLLPPLSPAYRARRPLALTLKDLRRIARGRVGRDWSGRVYGRLAVMPEEATPLQRAQLLACMAVGDEIMRLRRVAGQIDLSGLQPVLGAIAQGDSGKAIANLARFDRTLAELQPGSDLQLVLRARSRIIVLSEVLQHHAAYFNSDPS